MSFQCGSFKKTPPEAFTEFHQFGLQTVEKEACDSYDLFVQNTIQTVDQVIN